jgi:RNA polymerase sigma-70 factor (ECF subfamily)
MDEGTDDGRLAQLMKAAQSGDAPAYVKLLREVTPIIRRIVYSTQPYLKPEDIDDLVQDVLLSVHAVRATFDWRRPFLPWLIAITRNRIADGARRYARTLAHEVYVENLSVTFPAEPANLNTEGYRDPDALRLAVDSLPPGQRSAIKMLKLREMSLKETADATGTSIGALKIATHRAMAALRKKLTKDK